MDSTASTLALTKVLDVPELLETIIFFLPDREIFNNAQKVLRTWKASIAASPRLLRKSWQRKSKKPAVLPEQFASGRVVRVPSYLMPITVNSHLASGKRFRFLTADGISQSHIHSDDDDTSVTKCSLIVGNRFRAALPSKVTKSEATRQTWRPMQICDPPITVAKMNVDIFYQRPNGRFFKAVELMVYDKDGITMGLVYDTGVAAILSSRDLDLAQHSPTWSFELVFRYKTYTARTISSSNNDDKDESDGEDFGGAGAGDEEAGEDDIEANGEEEASSGSDGSGEAPSASNTESTMSQVLAIPELLENILSFLPELEIITSVQRVSHTWRSSIVDSPRIQRMLFLPKGSKPAAVSPARFSNFSNDTREDEELGLPVYNESVVSNKTFDAWILHPECRVIHAEHRCEPQARRAGDFHKVHHLWVEFTEGNPGGKAAFSHRPDFSWRSMQLCDPPITVASFCASSGRKYMCGPDIHATLFDRKGITLGLAYDTAAAVLLWNVGDMDPKIAWGFNVKFGVHIDAQGDRLSYLTADKIREATTYDEEAEEEGGSGDETSG
jgi:hypothetical protein